MCTAVAQHATCRYPRFHADVRPRDQLEYSRDDHSQPCHPPRRRRRSYRGYLASDLQIMLRQAALGCARP
ncbi:hypothetical protein GFM18_18095 [Rhizobium laguerreae]|nr:hypothetical protein [Rhizobium laguerreae]